MESAGWCSRRRARFTAIRSGFPCRRRRRSDPRTCMARAKLPVKRIAPFSGPTASKPPCCAWPTFMGLATQAEFFPLFVSRALQGQPLVLYGGQQVLDFVTIDTVVEALYKVGFGDLVPEPLNVGSGKGVTISKLCRRVLELTGWRSQVEIVAARQIEVTGFVADVTRARQVLGLEQPTDPLYGLPQLVDRIVRNNSRRQLMQIVAG